MSTHLPSSIEQRLSALECAPKSSPPLWEHRTYAISTPLPPIAAMLAQTTGRTTFVPALRQLFPRLGDTQPARRLKAIDDQALLRHVDADAAGIPVPADREGYYGEEHISFWLSGLSDALHLSAVLEEFHGAQQREATRLLDFGCASGRVLRHWASALPNAVVKGCDINRNNIRWMRTHLDARVVGFQNTVLPQLPIESDSLDLVYAFSVLTHIDDYEEGWLLELRRVLRPGGIAYLTFHSEHTWDQMRDEWHFMLKYFTSQDHRIEELPGVRIERELFTKPMPADRLVFVNTSYPINNTNVFHSHDYIRRRWGRCFDVARIDRKVHGEHQDGAVLIKR